jgi:hypothetical protein
MAISVTSERTPSGRRLGRVGGRVVRLEFMVDWPSAHLRRRAFALGLGSGVVGAALGLEGEAHARQGSRKTKIRKREPWAKGTLFTLSLEHAPFPTATASYEDDTVLVFVPSHHRLGTGGSVDYVVHFHGHNSSANVAKTHLLCDQLTESRQSAILVVPQGPTNASDGDFGKLMTKHGLENLLAEVRSVVSASGPSKALGKASLEGARSTGRVLLSAHSGGYLAAASCARFSTVTVREIFLFDALYAQVPTFHSWVRSPKSGDRKLVSYYVGGKPRENSLELARSLESEGVDVVRESGGKRVTRKELTRGRAVFLEGRGEHATAAYQESIFRDCLLASCLKGQGTGGWHEGKGKTR